jgi:hypothetical protein
MLLWDFSPRWLIVYFQILGKLESTSSEGDASTTPLLNETVVLWKIENDGNNCERPSQINFAVQLPNTFDNGGATQQLPPSYRVDFDTLPALMVRSSYALRFSFVRNSSRKLGLFDKRKSWVCLWFWLEGYLGLMLLIIIAYSFHFNTTLVLRPSDLSCISVVYLPISSRLLTGGIRRQ